ncbi:MAG: sugar kinase [Fuerstiella sp.]
MEVRLDSDERLDAFRSDGENPTEPSYYRIPHVAVTDHRLNQRQSPRQIVGIGSAVVDSQMLLEQFPGEDRKETAIELRQQTGGPVPTALAVLQRLGHSCHQIGPWGTDALGQFLEADLKREGITWSESCASADCITGLAHVWTATGNGTRTIVARPADWQHLRFSDDDRQRLEACDALHLDGNGSDLTLDAAKIVKASGGLVMVDAGAPKAATAELMSLADVFSFPERFAEQFYENPCPAHAAQQILQQGAKQVICTRGENGAIVYERSARTELSAYPVTVIDSTGAGDVFCGAVLAALLEKNSLVDSVRWASAAAALKCTQPGNRDALPTREAIDSLVRRFDRNGIPQSQ